MSSATTTQAPASLLYFHIAGKDQHVVCSEIEYRRWRFITAQARDWGVVVGEETRVIESFYETRVSGYDQPILHPRRAVIWVTTAAPRYQMAHPDMPFQPYETWVEVGVLRTALYREADGRPRIWLEEQFEERKNRDGKPYRKKVGEIPHYAGGQQWYVPYCDAPRIRCSATYAAAARAHGELTRVVDGALRAGGGMAALEQALRAAGGYLVHWPKDYQPVRREVLRAAGYHADAPTPIPQAVLTSGVRRALDEKQEKREKRDRKQQQTQRRPTSDDKRVAWWGDGGDSARDEAGSDGAPSLAPV